MFISTFTELFILMKILNTFYPATIIGEPRIKETTLTDSVSTIYAFQDYKDNRFH
jgi:hypothetical protein